MATRRDLVLEHILKMYFMVWVQRQWIALRGPLHWPLAWWETWLLPLIFSSPESEKEAAPTFGCEYCRWVHRLPYPDIVSKNISSERQAYARASVWRSCRLCSLLSPSRCWSERLNDPRSPARVLICHCLCCFAACERDPRCRAFRDQPVLMEPVTRCWCLLLLLCSVPATLFLPFWEAESTGQRLHLAPFNSVVTAVAVTPFGKSQGANRTVGHLSSYLAPFPFPFLDMVRIFFFFCLKWQGLMGGGVCVCWGGGSWASLATSAVSGWGPAFSWFLAPLLISRAC